MIANELHYAHKTQMHCQGTESVLLALSLGIFFKEEYGECQGKKHEINLVIVKDKVCMLISIVAF